MLTISIVMLKLYVQQLKFNVPQNKQNYRIEEYETILNVAGYKISDLKLVLNDYFAYFSFVIYGNMIFGISEESTLTFSARK